MLGRQAVVIGAGAGGLAAAAALSPHFESVTIFEKDELPDAPDVRAGAAQGAHSHALLKAGEVALERLLPGVRAELLAAGAVEINVGREWRVFEDGGWLPDIDCGFSVLGMSRPALERVIRVRVSALPGVVVKPGVRVRGVLVENGAAAGVELEPEGARVHADLVVDASGAGGAIGRRLIETAPDAVDVETLDIKIGYTTGVFETPGSWAGDRRVVYCQPTPPDARWGALIPIEGDRWTVSMAVRGAASPPRDLAGFLNSAAALPIPDIHARIAGARLTGALRSFRKPTAVWRRFDAWGGLPDRFLPLGDVAASFNPTFGQGMTAAFGQATALAEEAATAAQAGAGAAGLTRKVLPKAAAFSRRAWRTAALIDLEFPETEGRRPRDHVHAVAFNRAIRRLAETDEELYVLRMRVANMLEPPSAFRQAAVAARLAAEMARNPSAA